MFSPVLYFKSNKLTAFSVVSDDLFDLCYDVLNVGGDVADGGVQSLVHLGGQVLDVGDELLHLAEDVDQLEGRAQLGVACRRTQRSQQVESRPLCDRELSLYLYPKEQCSNLVGMM